MRQPVTPLDQFIVTHRLHLGDLTREANVSRQHLFRVRGGTMEPTRRMMVRIARACSVLTHKRVTVAELFDLDIVDAAAELEGINPS